MSVPAGSWNTRLAAAEAHDAMGHVVKVWQWTKSRFEVLHWMLFSVQISMASCLKVKDKYGQNVLIIEGPCCSWACFGDLEFRVSSL